MEKVEKLDDHFIDYNPLYKGDIKNPNRDPDSDTLYYLKKDTLRSEDRKDEFCHRFFVWLQKILKRVPKDQDIVFTIAPGHSPTSPRSFIHKLVGKVLINRMRIDGRGQLVRFKEVPKQEYSKEPRTKKTHRDSIKVAGEGDISKLNEGKVVFILDDIWTSGCTLSVCKEKIMETGATSVILLAIGKTVPKD